MKRRAMSLFAGAGGLDLGAHQAGFRTVCAAEFDVHCVSTLRRNLRGAAIWQVDVRALDPRRAGEALGLKPGALALLHGGPPCQPFSQIGKRLGVDDPRGRMIFEMVRFAAALRPTAVLIEQVPQFLRADGLQAGNMQEMLAEEFLRIGYDLHASILDSTAYGVPQRRKRAIIVCVPAGSRFSFSHPLFQPIATVGEAIGDLPPAVLRGESPLVPNHVDVTPARDRERISYVPEGAWLSKVANAPPDIRQRLTRKDTTKFRRLDRSLPSLTLRCGEALYHPTEDRYVTPRESARIQGFPDKHVFEGPIRRRTGSVRDLDQHRQVANAVPPPLARSVATDIRKALCLGLGLLAASAAPGVAQANPNILVDAGWLAGHRDDPGVVVLHAGMARMGGLEEYVEGAHFLEYHDIAVERNDLITELAPVEALVEAFRTAGVSNQNHVVVVGDPGHVAARVFMTLDYLGHGDRTSVLDGGLAAWKAAGGEVSGEPAAPARRGDFEADVREDMLVTAEWIHARLDDPGVTLIDARPGNEYTGERPGRDFLRGGHIPGAYNLYWQDLTREEIPALVDLAEVEARFGEAGATEGGTVVSYCLIGMRASYTYMISRYLGYDAKFYDASWNDWGRRDDLPLVTGRDRR